MSTPITPHASIFPAEGFCPGAGTMAVHVTDKYDFRTNRFEEAVRRSIPVCTSFGRPSPMLTERKVKLLYTAVRTAVGNLYAEWNARSGRKDKAPVVNRFFMDRWFERIHMDKAGTLTRLGVAQPGDTLDLCITPKGGLKVVVTTFENAYGEAFARRCGEAYRGELTRTLLMDALTDIAILTALAGFNRRMMYEQLCRACGWATVHKQDHLMQTAMAGLSLVHWEVFSGEVRVGDGVPFLLPHGKDSWVVCQAPVGEENVAVPWRVIHEVGECPLPIRNTFHTRVSVSCMPIEYCWCAEKNMEGSEP